MEEYWKRGERELLVVYKDEYGKQYLFFIVTGNKKFRLRYLSHHHDRLTYIQTLGEYTIEGKGWIRLNVEDNVLG